MKRREQSQFLAITIKLPATLSLHANTKLFQAQHNSQPVPEASLFLFYHFDCIKIYKGREEATNLSFILSIRSFLRMMDQISNFLHGLKPALTMVLVQVVFAGVNVLYKLASNLGMSLCVIVAYRFIFATAFMTPLALILERNSRPKLNWKILCQAFLCGLFGGSLCQNLYLESMALTSATFVSAMTNLTPATTFILAISFRMERLGIRTMAGKAKVAGTSVGIGGAMLMTFYKGVEVNIWSTNVDLLHHGGPVASPPADSKKILLGLLSAFGSCFCYALWLIVQAKMSENYPCEYSSSALMCSMGAIQAVIFALCKEKDWSQWKLGWNIKLLVVAYAGILSSGLMVALVTWCVSTRGPLYASIFNPLMLVLVAFVGSLILNEKLHLGSILGATLIVCGLYAVLWGKGKEMKKIRQSVPSKSSRESESIEIVVTSPICQTSSTNHNNKSNIVDEDRSSKENEAKEEMNKLNGDSTERENEENDMQVEAFEEDISANEEEEM